MNASPTPIENSIVALDAYGVTIHGVPVFIDQEGVAWDRSCGVCPKCYRTEGDDAPKYDPATRGRQAGYFQCRECDVVFDEPIWINAESAFITCISDDEARDDTDAGIRALYREYHDLPMEEGFVWPPRPGKGS
jgi:hypothetical protein